MCIAIFKPAEVTLTKAVLKRCFQNNPDGCGFAISSKKNDQVIVKKGFFRFRRFWHSFRQYQSRGESMMIHFRVATSGKVNGENCHPWQVDKNHALIHNGNLEHKLGVKDEHTSDTGLFVKCILQPIFDRNTEIWQNSAFKWLIEESIGTNNKLVMINGQGEHVIFNEKQGEWEHGCWFSNKTFKEERKKKYSGNGSATYSYTPAPNKYGYSGSAHVASQQQQLALPAPAPNETESVETKSVQIEQNSDSFVDISRIF